MRHHADRIRRIQALCAQLDHAIQDSHAVQQTVEELRTESGLLLEDLRPTGRRASRASRRPPGRARKNSRG